MRLHHAILIAASLLVSPAAAQTNDFAGEWVIDARQEQIRCTLTGRAVLTAQTSSRWRVALTTHEVCESGAEWRSEQTCLAVRDGARMTVDCAVLSATPSNYEPDDFALTIREDGTMAGALNSLEQWEALWRRPGAAFVS